ncbi:DUF6691 family protein [Dyella sp. KULCS107]|uniref:DUF6691 family protein n=1 Tax=Dyella sp. KULCS107 TaxID=3422216 RepID=UPI003D6DBFB5
MKITIALLAGLVFGLGLSLGGMTQPAVVLGFLDLFGAWDPRLVFVMGGAVLTTAIGYRLVFRRDRPLFESDFQLPTARRFDARLIVGSALFGTGWGIAGYCPGPALASLGGGAPSLLVLVATMVAGWWLTAKIPAARA